MNSPLAERMRPRTLDKYLGQQHIVGPTGAIRRAIDSGSLPSVILWGPPGTGKTTLAEIISHKLNVPFFTLSAVNAGVRDIRDIFARIDANKMFSIKRPILFIDEIHRFSKAQQDSLLAAVEKGRITLIGATTENPSFEVIRPLISRCQVYVLKPLEEKDMLTLINRALTEDPIMKTKQIEIQETSAIIRFAGGDARKLLNILELVTDANQDENNPTQTKIIVTDEKIVACLQENPAAYDKNGEMHYDIASAFIKSIRGSDPDAAIYWLARMVAAGEDPKFIARRLVISAAEDIGLANPNALLLANACFDALTKIGWPEGRIILAETTIYLAASPKSNSAYMAIEAALKEVNESGDLPVPLHLRNAPTELMKTLGYAKNYKYAHDYKGNFVKQEYCPEKLTGKMFYSPQDNPQEAKTAAFLNALKKERPPCSEKQSTGVEKTK